MSENQSNEPNEPKVEIDNQDLVQFLGEREFERILERKRFKMVTADLQTELAHYKMQTTQKE